MKITNKTHWKTSDLRAILIRVAADELDPAKRSKVRITIEYGRHSGTAVSGRAFVGGRTMRLFVQRGGIDPVDFACTAAHEMAHLRGLNHGAAMNCARYQREIPSSREYYGWAMAMPIFRQAVPLKITPDLKLEKARRMLAEKERKLRLAKTLVLRWKRRVAYYERKAESSARGAHLPHCRRAVAGSFRMNRYSGSGI